MNRQKQIVNIESKITSRNRKFNGKLALLIFGIVILTLLAYLPSLKNNFTNWDDYEYVVDNLLIRELSVESIQLLFSSYYMGNYHPLSMLSLAVNYFFSGAEPLSYILTNLMLHILNVILIFYLVKFLVKRLDISIITAVLFGVHTLHVESVAWVSERKDVLFVLFFLASLISYVKYIEIEGDASKSKTGKNSLEKRSGRLYRLTLFLFILSTLSKGMAVSLSITLLAIDYLKGRGVFSRKIIVEKIPFFIISIIFGIIAVYAQEIEGFGVEDSHHALYERFLFASYSFTHYLIKLIAPFKLSAFYPYPQDGMIPTSYWFYPLSVVAVIFIFFKYVKRYKELIFGVLFFCINIFLILQLMPVGDAIMADRYSYVPSIGFFFLIGLAFESVTKWKPGLKVILGTIMGLYILLIVFLTYDRCKVWENSVTLWGDVISKYPDVEIAYNNRGLGKAKAKMYEDAIKDYNKAIKLNSNYPKAYNNRGNSKHNLKDFSGAIKDYNKSIELDVKYAEAYNNRGNSRYEIGDLKGALSDMNKAVQLEPKNSEMFYGRGIMRSNAGNFQEAIIDFNKAIKLDPNNSKAYLNRGTSKFYLKDYLNAIKDFDNAIQINPDYGEAYYNRGIVKIGLRQQTTGCSDLSRSIELGFDGAKQDILKYCK